MPYHDVGSYALSSHNDLSIGPTQLAGLSNLIEDPDNND